MAMARTQVYFEPEVLDYLRQEAAKKNTTLAQVIRTKVIANMPAIKKKTKKKVVKYKNAGELLLAMAEEAKKLGASGPKDLATNPDKYLYGNI